MQNIIIESYGPLSYLIVEPKEEEKYNRCKGVIDNSKFRKTKKDNLIDILDYIGIDDFFWNIGKLSKFNNKQLVKFLKDKKLVKKKQTESYEQRIERIKQEINDSRMNAERKQLVINILTVRATHGENHNYNSIENEIQWLRYKSTIGLKRALLYDTILSL